MASLTELSTYIRFQLSQLSVKNKHHDFEHISRCIARLRICENILPATGPVGAGGDQGRDFETYRSYLIGSPLAGSTFLGLSQGKKIVFACSIQKNIDQKIKKDLQTICSSNEKIDAVYYFCEADISIAKRHKLQDSLIKQYQVHLEIFDGQAISEQLASCDLFWIATEYLSVPAVMFPRLEPVSELYQEYKQKWLNEISTPQNYADFFQIKYGLRSATFSKNERPDIVAWIKKMEMFLGRNPDSDLQRKAIYEISVASLRGMDNLTSRKERILEYFSFIDNLREMSELEDAAVLLIYCFAAHRANHFQIDNDILISWRVLLINRVEILLKNATDSQACAYLCMIRGYLEVGRCNIESSEKSKWTKVFKWWDRVVKEAKNSALFPLERFSDLLTELAKQMGNEPQYITLCNAVDELLTKRSGGYIAGEKCRDRAVSYYDSGKYLLAIKHLHKSKVHWLSAETIRGSVYSMLVISQCYEQLNLLYAAKYYASAAIVLIQSNYNDDEKHLLDKAFFRLANCCYRSGEWFEFMHVMHLALLVHINFDSSPLAIEMHEELQHLFVRICIMRIITERFSPEISKLVDESVAAWPMDTELRNGLDGLVRDQETSWRRNSLDEIWSEVQSGLSGRPFCDFGEIKKIEWKALGIEWLVEFKNEYSINAVVMDFVSVLQITVADLAIYDLCLLPTRVKVICDLTDGSEVLIEDVPDNTTASWRVSFPSSFVVDRASCDEMKTIFPLAASILNVCSVLPEKEFSKKIKLAIKEGLLEKTFFVRPFSECYFQVMSIANFNAELRSSLRPINDERKFQLNESEALSWIDSLGPGYSKKLAEKYLKNRYNDSIKSIRLTLPKLLMAEEFRKKIRKLKAEGFLDWQILLLLMNLSLNYRVRKIGGVELGMEEHVRISKQILYQEETAESIEIPFEVFSDEAINIQKNMLAPSTSKVWRLSIKQKTPDLNAIKKYLDIRYNNSIDDIDHIDYFTDI